MDLPDVCGKYNSGNKSLTISFRQRTNGMLDISGMKRKSNKIRDLFKVKLYTIRSEKERKRDRETNIY